MEASLAVSVVVPSHARHLRLVWLLNELERQTLGRGRWEVVVAHDYDRATAERVLDGHPLAEAGTLRHVPTGPCTAAHKRNVGWRAARGELVAFTDDDCRPEPDWLERVIATAADGGIVQGATRPDPLEAAILAAPHVRTMAVDPVTPYAQTCNIAYPRALLERLDGLDERAGTGEDVDLALRAQALGVAIVPAPDAIVNHAIESHTLPGIVRQNLKWRHLAYLTSRRPELRGTYPLGIFWDEEHMRTTLALAGLLGACRSRPLLALAAPYAIRAARRRGHGRRARAIAIAEMPGQLVRQGAEVVGLAAASLRHRTLVL